jgi:peptidoglycan-associated lipoprotein
MSRVHRVLALGVFLVAGAACHKKQPEVTPTPTPPPPSTPRVNEDSIARERARADSIAAAERAARDAAAARERAIAAARATLAAPVYFDYDMAEIRGDQQAQLEAKVPILTANPGIRIRVEGNTDDRGSDEYNLALGQRRAATVKRFLTDRGIDASRIEIVSYGEERPAEQGEGEDAWSKNRRAEFVITAGGDNITVSSQ